MTVKGFKEAVQEIEWHLKETEGENPSGTFTQGYEEGVNYAIGAIEHHTKESNKLLKLSIKELPTIQLAEMSGDTMVDLSDYVSLNQVINLVNSDNVVLSGSEKMRTAEQRAWEVIGRVYADAEKGRMLNPKNLFDSLLEKKGIINTITHEMSQREFEGNFDEFVWNLIKKTATPKIPKELGEWIEEKRNSHRYSNWAIVKALIRKFDDENGGFSKNVEKYITTNSEDAIKAIMNGYTVEEKLYYAKIKGHELIETEPILDEQGVDVSEWTKNIHFVLQKDGQLILDMKDSGLSGAKHYMTMVDWNKLGINENNAVFEEA